MNIAPLSDASIRKGAGLLREGKLVAFATETVYGLGADACNGRAVAEIFALKGRPAFNPLIVHVDDVAMAKRLVMWNEQAEKLARAFWPGPLTLVLPRAQACPVCLLASAGGETLAVRMPASAAARALIAAAGGPVAAPSANRSGRVSPTRVEHVHEEFGDALPLILDGGACAVGIESSVIDLTTQTPVLLRPGSVTKSEIEACLQCAVNEAGREGPLKSPGMLESHYAPALPVRLNVTHPDPNEALIAFGSNVPHRGKETINLSEAGDLKEAAANLFAAMRALDKAELMAINIMPIPEEGLGIAINDRLKRAAHR